MVQAGALAQAGADIVEVGGESTGPGSVDVSVEEEMDRVLTVIEAIKDTYPDLTVSVDTWKSEVAEAALNAGVSMVNDVTAGRGDGRMFHVVKDRDCDYVMMYSKDDGPRTTVAEVHYDDVTTTVADFLRVRMNVATEAGIRKDRIIIDPGMGHFVSSDARYSFELIRNMRTLASIAPVFVSPSRKSFLAGSQKLPADRRLPGTLAASALCVYNGARYMRTHDPLEVKQACDIAMHVRSD